MNRPVIDSNITRSLAALLRATYTEDIPTEAECDAMRGHVATLNDCIKQYQRRVDELERPASPDPEAVERVAGLLCDAWWGGNAWDEHAVVKLPPMHRPAWRKLAERLLAAGLDPSRIPAEAP